MSFGGFAGGPGFGGPGIGQGPAGCGPDGFSGPGGFGFGPGFGGHGGFGFGPGFGGHGTGPGFRGGIMRATFGTAALLLDGPADAAEITQRTSDATDGAFTPPQDVVDLAIGLLAGRGIVTVENGVASLTELGKNLLAWRGVTSESTHIFLGKFAQFADILTIGKTLHEIRGLARTIAWSGTETQKQALSDAKAQVLEAVTNAKKSLHAALAAD